VCGLSSARDRARLAERERAERARVERVLARGPRAVERRSGGRGAARCGLCAGDRILEDEIAGDRTRTFVRCLRCDHRWIQPLGLGQVRPGERWAGSRGNGPTGPPAPAFRPRVRRPRTGEADESAGAA